MTAGTVKQTAGEEAPGETSSPLTADGDYGAPVSPAPWQQCCCSDPRPPVVHQPLVAGRPRSPGDQLVSVARVTLTIVDRAVPGISTGILFRESMEVWSMRMGSGPRLKKRAPGRSLNTSRKLNSSRPVSGSLKEPIRHWEKLSNSCASRARQRAIRPGRKIRKVHRHRELSRTVSDAAHRISAAGPGVCVSVRRSSKERNADVLWAMPREGRPIDRSGEGPQLQPPGVSQPLGNETSQRADTRLTCTVTDFLRNLGRAMARVILVTMSHNLPAKIEYSSIVMRQVSGRRPELISTSTEVTLS